jgi:hypothetical protein
MADIGSTLREARMRARIDISEVEAKTKIRAKYLRAIENEEWDLLPGPVYAKTFLRTYSDYLGLDSRMLTDEFKRRYERPSDHDLRPIAAISRERERAARGPLIPPWAVIGLVLVGVLVALYLIGRGSSRKTPPAASTQAKVHHHQPPPHTRTTPKLPVLPATVKLQLVPTGAVYVCVVSPSGRKLIPGLIYNAGQTIPTEKAKLLLVTLGNASVQMKVNGKSVAVHPSASAIGLKIQPSGVTPLSAKQAPTCA